MFLSIVIPAFNAGTHMEDTLRSVAPLLGSATELVFVDDGSTDDTVVRFRDLQTKVPLANSRLLQQAHFGVSVARNTGLSAATGDYVLFLDSDDWVSGELLDAVSASIGGCTPDVVCWGWDTLTATGDVQRLYFDVHPVAPSEMTGVEALRRRTVDRSLRLWTSSAAYRRRFLENAALQFSPGCSVGEDLEFGYLALLHAHSVFFVPRVLAVYRKRSGSMTSSTSVERFGSVLALRRVLRELETDARPELKEITEYFRRNKELVNYFYTLEACLRARKAGSPTDLLHEIDGRFPSLNTELRLAILRSSGSIPFEWRLFSTSPMLWWIWIRIRRRIDGVLPPRLRSRGPTAEKRRALFLAG
ncbi:glycosyltransferase family 2 protein [Mycolicibacterium sp. F2034L]|uniref:glycosyltransferase family 2 protein n=1 Tax=Mycolicibacterium sp. F2034L TaxID=2926422 RepID=UPI001FF1C1EB|nr:glycosyltransferase family 2 protein [Mycolicibacterium sp. F2034L]MCK0177112.1 glycosyltransferase family 2 protein [Mycolicibacterium sp. F2034L]